MPTEAPKLPVNEEETDEEKEEPPEEVPPKRLLADRDSEVKAPIDVSIGRSVEITLPELSWTNFDAIPTKMRLTNTGKNLVLSVNFRENTPYISGGPLPELFVVCQLHFHWGRHLLEGSEHKIEGSCAPCEMHLVMRASSIPTLDIATVHKNCIAIFCYFFQLVDKDNKMLKDIFETLPKMTAAGASHDLEPRSLDNFILQFEDDYLMYWGNKDHNKVMWLICRIPMRISKEQMEVFKELEDREGNKKYAAFGGVDPMAEKPDVFHVNPSKNKYKTLYLMQYS